MLYLAEEYNSWEEMIEKSAVERYDRYSLMLESLEGGEQDGE